MERVLSDLVGILGEVPALWAYGLLLVVAFAENVFPPVPGDVCIVFAGYLASVGTLELGLVVPIATASGILGFMTVFYIGRTVGQRLVGSPHFPWISERMTDKVAKWTRRWGSGVVLTNRFLMAARAVIALSVGMGSMHAVKALVYSSVSALVWTGLLAWTGYLMGENWERVWYFLVDYSRMVLIIIVAGICVAVWWNRHKKRSNVARG